MKILPNYNINFGTSHRIVYQKEHPDCIDHMNETCFFDNFQWDKGFDFFIDKYKNTDKVNIYSLGCSDCSEALSIAMLLDTKLKDKSDKFFPIIAVDNDEEIIANIKSGYIALSPDDEQSINKYTNNNLNKYLTRTSINYNTNNNVNVYRRKTPYTRLSDRIEETDKRKMITLYRISPDLLNKIKVVNADVRDYVDSLDNKNNLIFARDFWIYIQKDAEEFLHKLSDKTDKNSFLVIGDYDYLACPLVSGNAYGFSMNPNINNVFDKSGSNYFDDMKFFNKFTFTTK